MADRLPMTTHAKIEAERQAVAAARIEQQRSPWRETLGRPLAHAIRYTLDVSLPRDIAWIESCRDTEGEELLALLRNRLHEMTVDDWRALREGKPHVQRLLAYWRIYNPVSTVGTLCPEEATTQQQAEALMAGFCHPNYPPNGPRP